MALILKLLAEIKGTGYVLREMRKYYKELSQNMGENIDKHFGRCREVFKETHVPDLTEVLAGYSSMWNQIALSLRFPYNEIKNIRDTVSGPELRLAEVLSVWVGCKIKCTKAPTLAELEKALGSEIVGLGTKAKSLREDLAEEGITFSEDDSVTDLQNVPERKNPPKFEILSQTPEIVVTEGKVALLEVQISSIIVTEYEWYKKEANDLVHIWDNDNECILCLAADDLTVEGSYVCKVSRMFEDELETLWSEPIQLSVSTPLDQYRDVLSNHYREQPEVPEDTWPPVNIDTFISLALIKSETLGIAGEYGRLTIRGDVDDIFQDKEEISYKMVFNGISSGARMLIEGRPGSGKTTLVHKVSQDWANGMFAFSCVRLVFLIHLRGFCSDPAIGLDDFLNCYFRDHAGLSDIRKYTMKHSGLGLCFILDGLDEYVPNNKSAYTFKLIEKKVLPKAIVIVASRPVAAANFRRSATRQIEVLGFLKKQIDDYIEKYSFSVGSKRLELRDYLAEHPNVHHMCYLPIHTSMVCFLYDNIDSVIPQTETEIYAEFTKFTILRILYRDCEPEIFESVKDLPSPQMEIYFKICQLAFKMCTSSKQVMREVEVKSFFVTSREDKGSLGLITIDKMATRCGFQKLFTFLHLTFQEFLAACYISDLDQKEQIRLIEQYQNAKHMKQVWKFYCGLIQFEESNSYLVQTLIEQTQHGSLFQVQCCFESQQSCTSDSAIKDNTLSFSDSFLTSSDFACIAYVITNAQQQVRIIEFHKCTIGIEGVNVLVDKCHSKLSSIVRICYHGHKCVSEQLLVLNKLIQASPSLAFLDITNTNLGEEEIKNLTDSLSHGTLQIVKANTIDDPSLKHLLAQNLSRSCNRFLNMCFSGMDGELSNYLYCNRPVLNMSFYKLQPLEVQVLSEDLMINPICRRLTLVKCGIDDEMLFQLVRGLKNCINLETLELGFNNIGDIGAASLEGVLGSCLKLCTLDLSCNRISSVGAVAIANAIKGKTPCKLYFWGNSVTKFQDPKHDIDIHTFKIMHQAVKSYTKSLLCVTEILNDNIFCTLDLRSSRITTERVKSIHALLEHCAYLKVLDISDNKLDGAGIEFLVEVLKLCPALCEFFLGLNQIGDRGAEALSGFLKVNSCMRVLDISSNEIKHYGACSLAEGLKHCVGLHSLQISSNSIGNEGAKALANALQVCTNLEEVDVSDNYIGMSGANANALNAFTSLQQLDISCNGIESEGATALADGLKFCASIQDLRISYNDIGNEGVIALAGALKFCTSLQTLAISSNHIGDEGAIALAGALKFCTNLQIITVSSNNIRQEGAIALAGALKFCTSLEILDISSNSLSDEGVIALAGLNFFTSLQKLAISSNRIGDEGAIALAGALKFCTCLQKLAISTNYFGDEGAIALAGALKFCTSLQELAVCSNCINDEGVVALAGALKFCTHFEILDISSNCFWDKGVIALAGALKFYPSLQTLAISSNCIKDEGAIALAGALKFCTSLQELAISSNHIGDEGAIALAGALKFCTSLQKLDISSNRIGDEGAIALAGALKFCTSLQKLDISSSRIGGEGVIALAGALKFCTSLII